jgi:hypothetical protein
VEAVDAGQLAASSRVPKKVFSKTRAVRTRRSNGFAAPEVDMKVPMVTTGSTAPTIRPRWP